MNPVNIQKERGVDKDMFSHRIIHSIESSDWKTINFLPVLLFGGQNLNYITYSDDTVLDMLMIYDEESVRGKSDTHRT